MSGMSRTYKTTGMLPQAVLDHEVYYLNVTDANLTNKPQWLLEYSAKVKGLA